MIQTWRKAADLLRLGEDLVLATVVESRGSTPREPGATMVVRRNGEIVGSVGGGSGEGDVIEEARTGAADAGPRYTVIDMWGSGRRPDAMVCGGRMKILLEPLSPATTLPWITVLVDELENGRSVGIVRALPGAGDDAPSLAMLAGEGGEILWTREGAPPPDIAFRSGGAAVETVPLPNDAGRLLVQKILPPDRLIIVGGGHIAVPLCDMAAALDFRVTVIDDRPEFSAAERFPAAADTLCGDYVPLLDRIPGGETAYFALVTRGYGIDVEAVPVLLKKRFRYIGMIGSGRRIRTVKEKLETKGIAAADLDMIHAPIGLAIGAVTPAEIAASIVAELIAVRRAEKEPCAGDSGARSSG